MDHFAIIYKILSTLEKSLDLAEFDADSISAEYLGISFERWAKYMEMMMDSGLIKGVYMQQNISGSYKVDARNAKITLKGLEYLQENSLMKKAYIAAKGIKEITPFI